MSAMIFEVCSQSAPSFSYVWPRRVSSATVCRINRCLIYGAGGYSMMLKRLKEKKEEK